MIDAINIGQTYTSGNTHNATESLVLEVDVEFDALPARVQEHFRVLKRTGSGRAAGPFVRFVSHRRHDHDARPGCSGYLWQSVFLATHFESLDAMCAAYVAAQQPARGLPGAVLPGDR